jgi:hypothetical protein
MDTGPCPRTNDQQNWHGSVTRGIPILFLFGVESQLRATGSTSQMAKSD